MERSEIWVGIDAARSFPDFASFHPGYLLSGLFNNFLDSLRVTLVDAAIER
jgi:hypothetical protein